MNPAFRFNQLFGLKIRDRLDGTYYSLLIIILFFISAAVSVTANLDYEKLNQDAYDRIRNRYKDLVSQLIMDQKAYNAEFDIAELTEEDEKKNRDETKEDKRKAAEKKIEESVRNRFSIGESGGSSRIDKYAELPDDDDLFENINFGEPAQLTYNSKTWPARGARSVDNFDAGDITNPLKRPFNYLVDRKGEIFINFTDEMINEPQSPAGYRNPEEIERVVTNYQPMIEQCFRKVSRYSSVQKGFVQVSFDISPEGFVIPESIRIISSSIRNKQFEKCLKEYIRRWRSFEKLDDSMGIAQVVQKFIFN